MAWVICDREITCRDDLIGLPSTEVWATLLYASHERYNAINSSDYYTLDLDYCRSVVRGKNLLDSDIYYAIGFEKSNSSSYWFYGWADPEAGDGEGDFSGLADMPILTFPQIPEPDHGSLMADAAWAHILQFRQAQYPVLFFDPTALNSIGLSIFGLSMTFPYRSIYMSAGAPSAAEIPGAINGIRLRCELAKASGSYSAYSSSYPGMPAALCETTAYGSSGANFKWHNNWCDVSIVKSRAVSVDFYMRQTLTRYGSDYSPPATDGTFQLKHAFSSSESSFSFRIGEAWSDPLFTTAPGYAGYESESTFALVVKPVFQYS